MGWIYLLSKMALKLVNTTFAVVLTVTTISGFSMILSGLYLYGVSLLVVAAVAVLFFIFLQPRLAFATTNLKVACEAIKAMPSTLLAAAFVLGLQGMFFVLWMLAAMGTATNEATTTISYAGKSYPLSHCSSYQYINVRSLLVRFQLDNLLVYEYDEWARTHLPTLHFKIYLILNHPPNRST
jgi:hypothetical protein